MAVYTTTGGPGNRRGVKDAEMMTAKPRVAEAAGAGGGFYGSRAERVVEIPQQTVTLSPPKVEALGMEMIGPAGVAGAGGGRWEAPAQGPVSAALAQSRAAAGGEAAPGAATLPKAEFEQRPMPAPLGRADFKPEPMPMPMLNPLRWADFKPEPMILKLPSGEPWPRAAELTDTPHGIRELSNGRSETGLLPAVRVETGGVAGQEEGGFGRPPWNDAGRGVGLSGAGDVLTQSNAAGNGKAPVPSGIEAKFVMPEAARGGKLPWETGGNGPGGDAGATMAGQVSALPVMPGMGVAGLEGKKQAGLALPEDGDVKEPEAGVPSSTVSGPEGVVAGEEADLQRQREEYEAGLKRLEADPVVSRFARQMRELDAEEKVMRENIRATVPEAEQGERVQKLEAELLFERLRVGKAMNRAVRAEADAMQTAAGIAHRKGLQAYEGKLAEDEKLPLEKQMEESGPLGSVMGAVLDAPLRWQKVFRKVAEDFGPYDHRRERVQERARSEEAAEALRREAVKKTGLDPDNPDHVRLLEDAKKMDWTTGGQPVGESAASGEVLAEVEAVGRNMIQSLTKGKWDVSRVENSRVLSNGAVVVNPLLIQDDVAYTKAVQEAEAAPEAKKQAMALLRDLQRGQAKALLPSLKSTPDIFPGEPFADYAARRAEEEPRFGALPEAEQARLFLREQMQRGYGTRLADKLGTSLLLGIGDVFAQVGGLTGMVTGMAPGWVPGAGKVSEFYSQGAADLGMLGAMVDESTEARTGTGALGRVTGGVARMLPGLAAQALVTRGLRVNVLPPNAAKAVIFGLAGAQTAGAQYASLYGELRRQGAKPMEAWLGASGPAMASGLVTAGLTAAGGATGTEALLMPGAREKMAQGLRGFWKQALKNVPAHAVKEVPEEFFDEMASTVIEAAALGKDPRAALGDLLAESPEFIGSVMLLGGSGGVKESSGQTQGSPPVPVPLMPGQEGAADVEMRLPPRVSSPTPLEPTTLVVKGQDGSSSVAQQPVTLPPAAEERRANESAPGAALEDEADTGLLPETRLPGRPVVEPEPAPDVRVPERPFDTGHPAEGVAAMERERPGLSQRETPAVTQMDAVQAPGLPGEREVSQERDVQTTEAVQAASPEAAPAVVQQSPAAAAAPAPIWQGQTTRGQAGVVESRNADGTFQVRINGAARTFSEPQVAAMTGLKKAPLYEMLGQATRAAQTARAGSSDLRPIWQGQTTRGQAGVAESRNADGTFQVRINGAARTFNEPQVAAMTGLKKGLLYEMLERATMEGQSPPNIPAVFTAGYQPTVRRKKRFHSRMDDTPTSDGHLTPGLLAHQSPKNFAEARAALEPLVQKSDEYVKRWEEIQSRLDIVSNAIQPKPGQPSKLSFLNTPAETAERSRLGAEMRNLMEEERILRQEQDRLAAEARSILAIPEKERGKVRFIGEHLENFTPELAKTWKTAREGALIVEQYVHPGLLPEVGVHVAFHNRSSYTHRNDSGNLERTTYLTPAAGVITAAHEITHAIECQEVEVVINGRKVILQPLYEKARKFLLARARGVPAQKLQDLAPNGNYQPHEMAFEDDWHKKGGEHYTGRDYVHAMTEIFTMGLQRMHDDPVRFFSEDPEHFAIVLQLRYPIQP